MCSQKKPSLFCGVGTMFWVQSRCWIWALGFSHWVILVPPNISSSITWKWVEKVYLPTSQRKASKVALKILKKCLKSYKILIRSQTISLPSLNNWKILEVQIQVRRFIDKYLKTDGIFILRMIAQHADVVFTTDLISRLWDSHYKIEKQRE